MFPPEGALCRSRGLVERLEALLRPTFRARSLAELDPAALKSQGVKGLLIDVDNTLVPWGTSVISAAAYRWVQRARAEGMGVCLMSNSAGSRRVKVLAKRLGVPCVYRAAKPRARPYLCGMQQLGLSRGHVAVVGDQVFTDTLGGNRLGLHTILVSPLSPRDFPATKIVRLAERWVLRWLERRGNGLVEARKL